MRAGLVVSGVLGLGTALTFAAALLVGSLFPNGTLVGSGSGFSSARIIGKGAVILGGPAFVNGITTITVAPAPISNTAPADGSAPGTPEASPGG